eukprot:101135-Pelagomonas_calceolata.AAC.1
MACNKAQAASKAGREEGSKMDGDYARPRTAQLLVFPTQSCVGHRWWRSCPKLPMVMAVSTSVVVAFPLRALPFALAKVLCAGQIHPFWLKCGQLCTEGHAH